MLVKTIGMNNTDSLFCIYEALFNIGSNKQETLGKTKRRSKSQYIKGKSMQITHDKSRLATQSVFIQNICSHTLQPIYNSLNLEQ